VKRRLFVIAVAAAPGRGGASAAQALGGNNTSAGGYWGCVGTYVSDHTVCFTNPLPERLPIPAPPSAPSTPT
jgi:hypothetical protein